jgi:hypothetical protein
LGGVLAGCVNSRVPVERQEAFDSASTFARTYATAEAQACEAARRALLSQGYIVGTATAQQVRGRKSFQSGSDAHAEVEVTVVCAREGNQGLRTVAFVNAVQESFRVRKSNNSASLGLPLVGAVSLPVPGSDESLVKVGSMTITSPVFYERFFRLVEKYLGSEVGAAPASASGPASASAGASVPAVVGTNPADR